MCLLVIICIECHNYPDNSSVDIHRHSVPHICIMSYICKYGGDIISTGLLILFNLLQSFPGYLKEWLIYPIVFHFPQSLKSLYHVIDKPF